MSAGRHLLQLLSAPQRRAAVGLLGAMLLGTVLEMLGVGLVIPVMALVTQGDLAARYPAMAPWLDGLGAPNRERLVIIGMLSLASVSVIRALFLAYLASRQANFAYGVQADISQRLFAGYLRQPYVFHLQRNSAQLTRNATAHADELRAVIQSSLLLGSEALALLGILSLLLVVEPIGTLLVVAVLGVATWGFHNVTRDRILRWGMARQLHEGLRLQHLQQGLGSAKDARLLGREEDFIEQYRRHNTGNAQVGARQAAMQALPRLWLEVLAVTGLATVAIVIIGQGKPIQALVPTVGLFAAAAFRLMPSVTRVVNAVQSIRFSLPAIDTVHTEIRLVDAKRPRNPGPALRFASTIALDQVGFRYPGAEIDALCDVTLAISRGTTIGFVGTTGAGKSTVADIILGLLTPDSGAMRVDGVDIQTNLRSWQDQIGYVPQVVFLTDDTVRRNVAFGVPADRIDDAAVWRAVRSAQLEQYVRDLPHGLDTTVGERGIRLSGGERQRIGIARALYHDPSVLVLDEATSSLDTMTERGVIDAVRALRGDKTVLIVAHRLSTIEHCDRVFRLERGRVVEERPRAVAPGPSAQREEPAH
jgi:ABC-type multidrug transport system fused ATPase/permease subunit